MTVSDVIVTGIGLVSDIAVDVPVEIYLQYSGGAVFIFRTTTQIWVRIRATVNDAIRGGATDLEAYGSERREI